MNAGSRAPQGSGRRRVPSGAVDAWLAWAGLVSSGLALAAVADLQPSGSALRAAAVLIFWLVAPGAATVTRLRLPATTKVAATPLIGISLLIAVSTVGSWTGVWLPRVSVAVIAAACLVLCLLHPATRRSRLRRPHPARPRLATVLLGLALLGAVGLWVASLPGIVAAPPSVLGLLVAGPPTFAAAILAVTAVLLAALATRSRGIAVASVAALILVLRATAAVTSTVPTAAWTYKHLGVVQSLQAHHHVAAGMDIYMNWPGLFAAGAYFSDSTGVPIIDVARWFPPLVHVLLALQAAAIARTLGARATGATAAAALVVALNWVGQDYFSPQGIAMALAGGVILLLLQSGRSRAAGVLALVPFAGIVVTHQLTPFWLLILAAALVILRRTPWWVGAAMVVILGGFLLSRLQVAEAYGLFSGFDPVANATGNVPSSTALGRDIGGLTAKASSLLMWLSTLLVLAQRALRLGWRRGWRDRRVLVPGAIAFSPFVLLFGQNYGGEAILRVTLYSTVGAAVVLGPALATAVQRRAPVALAAGAWALVIVLVTNQSFFSQWSVNLIHPEDAAAGRWLANQPSSSVVIPIINDWPGRTWTHYERYIQPFATLEPGLDDILRTQDNLAGSASLPLDIGVIDQVVRAHPAPRTYIVFSAAMRASDAYYADFTRGSYQATLDQLNHSPEWRLVRHQNDLWVFEYIGPPTPIG